MIQLKINWVFIKIFKIDLSDFESLDSYHSLQEIFTRKLKKERLFSQNKKDILSPTDSKIFQCGDIEGDEILQVKGISYSLSDFLTPQVLFQKVRDGKFINFYLSPQDYHHFHAPMDMYIHNIVHIPGTLFPVKESFLKKHKAVFTKNERIVLEGITENEKIYYFVLIGAFNVGKIRIYKEPILQTNISQKNDPIVYTYKKSIFFPKGEDIGYFALGSSVVMLFEKGLVQLYDNLRGKKVKFGDTVAKFL